MLRPHAHSLFAACVAGLACLTGVANAQTAQPTAPRPRSDAMLDFLIRPVRPSGQDVSTIQVRVRVGAPSTLRGPFGLRAPLTYASVRGIADGMENLQARDRHGVIPLRRLDDRADRSGFARYRHWVAQRGVEFPVTVTYRFRLPTDVPVVGPQFDLRAQAGGFSGSGVGFLIMLEEGPVPFVSRVHWDLSDLAPGSVATSTFADGDFDVRGDANQVHNAYYMAGPLMRYPERGSDSGFVATWLDAPPFEPIAEMQWASRMYGYLRRFFRDTSAASFHVFVRPLPGMAGSPGTALHSSFMLAVPSGQGDSARTAPRETIVHEMVHYWANGLLGEPGANAWFNEGLATHYASLLSMRAGLSSVDSYIQSVNGVARAYYVSPARNLTLDSLRALGFSGGVGPTSPQNMPYVRGSLYFADLDARIRAASGGRRGLDDVLVPLFARIRQGARVDRNGFVDLIVKELGPAARKQFEAVILRGETIVPSSDAFGPCLARREVTLKKADAIAKGYDWVRVPEVSEDRCRQW